MLWPESGGSAKKRSWKCDVMMLGVVVVPMLCSERSARDGCSECLWLLMLSRWSETAAGVLLAGVKTNLLCGRQRFMKAASLRRQARAPSTWMARRDFDQGGLNDSGSTIDRSKERLGSWFWPTAASPASPEVGSIERTFGAPRTFAAAVVCALECVN